VTIKTSLYLKPHHSDHYGHKEIQKITDWLIAQFGPRTEVDFSKYANRWDHKVSGWMFNDRLKTASFKVDFYFENEEDAVFFKMVWG